MTDTAATPQKKSWNPLGGVFTVLGILMGTASLISLVQRWTGVEIVAEIARDALSIYRQMMESFKTVLDDWLFPLFGWSFEMPMWGMDLLAIWALCSFATMRNLGGQKRDDIVWRSVTQNTSAWRRVLLILAVLLGGPVSLARLIYAQIRDYRRVVRFQPRERASSGRQIAMEMAFNLVYAPQLAAHRRSWILTALPFLGTIAFFIWNAIQISPQ